MLKRAPRFMTRNYSRETGSMTGIFEGLKWEILQLRKGERIIGPYYCKKVCEVKSNSCRRPFPKIDVAEINTQWLIR